MDVHLLDELTINATAASMTQVVDGWLLRSSPQLPFHRCNSAIPMRRAALVPVDTIELFYGAGPACALVPTTIAPENDELLRDRGYEIEAPVDVLVATKDALIDAYEPNAAITTSTHSHVDEAFAQTYSQLHDNDERVLAYGRMMQTIAPEIRMVTAQIDGEPVGMAYGVVERGWCGVYGVSTLAHARRQRIATTVMHALAHEVDADNFYLQVERDNAAAHALYHKTFTPAYGYHYRVRG